MFPGSDLDPKILFVASSKTSLDLRHQGLQEFVNILRESGMCAADEAGDCVVHFCSNTMIHLLFEYMAYAHELYLEYTEHRSNKEHFDYDGARDWSNYTFQDDNDYDYLCTDENGTFNLMQTAIGIDKGTFKFPKKRKHPDPCIYDNGLKMIALWYRFGDKMNCRSKYIVWKIVSTCDSFPFPPSIVDERYKLLLELSQIVSSRVIQVMEAMGPFDLDQDTELNLSVDFRLKKEGGVTQLPKWVHKRSNLLKSGILKMGNFALGQYPFQVMLSHEKNISKG